MTALPPPLVEAYQRTRYRAVFHDVPIELRIGQPAPVLDTILFSWRLPCAAFLTADNPLGVRQDNVVNARAGDRLRGIVATLGLPFGEGDGAGDGHDWPPERSLLVLGVERGPAAEIAGRFEQNALVFVERCKPVELVLLR